MKQKTKTPWGEHLEQAKQGYREAFIASYRNSLFRVLKATGPYLSSYPTKVEEFFNQYKLDGYGYTPFKTDSLEKTCAESMMEDRIFPFTGTKKINGKEIPVLGFHLGAFPFTSGADHLKYALAKYMLKSMVEEDNAKSRQEISKRLGIEKSKLRLDKGRTLVNGSSICLRNFNTQYGKEINDLEHLRTHLSVEFYPLCCKDHKPFEELNSKEKGGIFEINQKGISNLVQTAITYALIPQQHDYKKAIEEKYVEAQQMVMGLAHAGTHPESHFNTTLAKIEEALNKP